MSLRRPPMRSADHLRLISLRVVVGGLVGGHQRSLKAYTALSMRTMTLSFPRRMSIGVSATMREFSIGSHGSTLMRMRPRTVGGMVPVVSISPVGETTHHLTCSRCQPTEGSSHLCYIQTPREKVVQGRDRTRGLVGGALGLWSGFPFW